MKGNILQAQVVLIAGIAEIHVLEIDAAIGYIFQILFAIMQITALLQHFGNTLCAGTGHGQHDENHGEHHQAHEDLHDVGQHAHQFACGEACYRIAAGGND